MGLHEMVLVFTQKWGPVDGAAWDDFIRELRALLEAYGRAALEHESLPDTEHEHGGPA